MSYNINLYKFPRFRINMATIEDFMKTATDEQKELLSNLAKSVEQEKEYADKINRIYGSISSEVYSPDGVGNNCMRR